MSILKFVTQTELDDLDEDHRVAFMQMVNIAQRRLDERLQQFDQSDEGGWRAALAIQHSFMNVVLAAAKRYEIEPFHSMSVPTRTNFGGRDFEQFSFDLDHYVTQLILDNSLRSRKDSVEILPKSKDQIRSYVHGLRECLERANITDAKREALLKRLDAFEKELEKRRLSMLAVTRIAIEILAIPGALWASADLTLKLVNNVMQVVADAKAAEQETTPLPSAEPFKALMAPREEAAKPRPGFGGGFGDDLDDDVPF